MRISDWSSDVCSSDLEGRDRERFPEAGEQNALTVEAFGNGRVRACAGESERCDVVGCAAAGNAAPWRQDPPWEPAGIGPHCPSFPGADIDEWKHRLVRPDHRVAGPGLAQLIIPGGIAAEQQMQIGQVAWRETVCDKV